MKHVILGGILTIVLAAGCDAREGGPGVEVRVFGREGDRLRMVQEQIRDRGVSDPWVLEAMEIVPRHEFVDAGFFSDSSSSTPR